MADNNLDHLYPYPNGHLSSFREKIKAILMCLEKYAEVHMPGYTWIITEGFRSTARQKALYAQGRTKPGAIVTHKNGTTNPSNHQSSLAVDFAPKKGKKLDYQISEEHWDYLGHLARMYGLNWGGDWKSFKDKPHVEWDTKDTNTYKLAREWQKQQGLR